MLAEKYAYLEEMIPEVEPRRREPTRHKEQSRKEQLQTAPAKKHGTLNKIVTIGLVLLCFAAASFTVYRYALISDNHKAILELENQLKQERLRRDKLEVELSYSEDLNAVEFSATEIGMKYPEAGQVQYVDLPQQQKVAEQADASIEQSDQSLLSRFLGLSN
jgi:cell division protein FtsL